MSDVMMVAAAASASIYLEPLPSARQEAAEKCPQPEYESFVCDVKNVVFVCCLLDIFT
jgi:hypothetical protein